MNKPKIELTELNIEEMCIFAEGVMHALYMNYADYDDEGNEIAAKYYDKCKDFHAIHPSIIEEKKRLIDSLSNNLLYNLFRRGDEIGEVRDYTLEDIKPWIEPLIPRALGIFRKGIGVLDDNNYIVADSVSDEYLIALFAREVRNMMMIFAGQRLQAKSTNRYLLLLESPSCHDMDKWIGIYFDDKNLRKAYEELSIKLEKMKEEDNHYKSMKVAIWKFRPRDEYEVEEIENENITDVQILQEISYVNPEELRCFKKDIQGE